MISRFPSGPKRVQLFLEVLTTTESSRRHRKALQRHSVRDTVLNKLASFSLKKYGSEKAHRLALEWTRRMQWMCDIYATQDDEAFEYSDAHFASYLHVADGESFLWVRSPGRDRVLEQGERPSALFGLCRQYAIVVQVTR